MTFGELSIGDHFNFTADAGGMLNKKISFTSYVGCQLDIMEANCDLDTEVDKFEKCWDCGSTIPAHHTKLCELSGPNHIRDLPAQPGTQWWTEASKTGELYKSKATEETHGGSESYKRFLDLLKARDYKQALADAELAILYLFLVIIAFCLVMDGQFLLAAIVVFCQPIIRYGLTKLLVKLLYRGNQP